MKYLKEDQFEVLRKLLKNPESSQRQLAEQLGFSLGKLNYCLRALKDKGLIKLSNFKKIQINLIIFMCLHQKVFLKKQN